MAGKDSDGPCGFDSLFTKNVPHIIERIFFSIDYRSYKNCSEVSNTWKSLLTSEEYKRKARSLFADNILKDEFTRCHVSPNGKESIQCLVCSKWFAVPPVKHLRGHMITFKEEKRRLVSLVNGAGHVCIICYDVFDDIVAANQHFTLKHEFSMASIFPNGIPAPANSDDIVELSPSSNPSVPHLGPMTPSDDLPTVIDHSVQPQLPGMAGVTPAPPPLLQGSSKKKVTHLRESGTR